MASGFYTLVATLTKIPDLSNLKVATLSPKITEHLISLISEGFRIS